MHIALSSCCQSYYIFAIIAFFLFHDTATPEIYTLSLHDALPISGRPDRSRVRRHPGRADRGTRRRTGRGDRGAGVDRKSTRLNSSHTVSSYAVFCLKKKKKKATSYPRDSSTLTKRIPGHAEPTPK